MAAGRVGRPGRSPQEGQLAANPHEGLRAEPSGQETLEEQAWEGLERSELHSDGESLGRTVQEPPLHTTRIPRLREVLPAPQALEPACPVDLLSGSWH